MATDGGREVLGAARLPDERVAETRRGYKELILQRMAADEAGTGRRA